MTPMTELARNTWPAFGWPASVSLVPLPSSLVATQSPLLKAVSLELAEHENSCHQEYT